MNLIEIFASSVKEAFEDLYKNPLRTLGIGLLIFLSFVLSWLLPFVGGLIGAVLIIKSLELMTNKKANKLTYYSTFLLFIWLSTFPLFISSVNWYFPNLLSAIAIYSIILFIVSLISVPQILASLYGRKKFSLSKGDVLFFLKVVALTLLIVFLANSFIMGLSMNLLLIISLPLLILKVPIKLLIQYIEYLLFAIALFDVVLVSFALYIIFKASINMAKSLK